MPGTDYNSKRIAQFKELCGGIYPPSNTFKSTFSQKNKTVREVTERLGQEINTYKC